MHGNIPDERTTYVKLDLWQWASYKDTARGSREGTTKEMAGLKLSHEEKAVSPKVIELNGEHHRFLTHC